MEDIKTVELVEELTKREGVQHIWVNPYNEVELVINHKKQDLHISKGPARILVIYD